MVSVLTIFYIIYTTRRALSWVKLDSDLHTVITSGAVRESNSFSRHYWNTRIYFQAPNHSNILFCSFRIKWRICLSRKYVNCFRFFFFFKEASYFLTNTNYINGLFFLSWIWAFLCEIHITLKLNGGRDTSSSRQCITNAGEASVTTHKVHDAECCGQWLMPTPRWLDLL